MKPFEDVCYHIAYRYAYRYACRYHLHADSEDCAIEFCELLLKKQARLPHFRSDVHRTAWISRCAKNWVLDYCRLHRYLFYETNWADESDCCDGQQFEEECCADNLKNLFAHALDAVLQNLPEETRQMWEDRYLAEQPFKVIAQKFQSSPDCVRMRVARANKCLKRSLPDAGFTETDADELRASLATQPASRIVFSIL